MSVATPSAAFTAYPTPSNLPLCFSLLCHVFIILVFSSPPDTYPTAPAYLLLLPHHTCHFSPFSPLSEAAGQRDTLSLTCYAADYQGKSAAATQSETRKGKTSATAEKGNYILSVCSILIALLILLHPMGRVGKLCSCKGTGTIRRFLYLFRMESLCKRDFGCTSTDADQLNDNHEVCRW